MKDSTIEKKFTKLYDTELSEIDGGFIPLIWESLLGSRWQVQLDFWGGLAWGYFK